MHRPQRPAGSTHSSTRGLSQIHVHSSKLRVSNFGMIRTVCCRWGCSCLPDLHPNFPQRHTHHKTVGPSETGKQNRRVVAMERMVAKKTSSICSAPVLLSEWAVHIWGQFVGSLQHIFLTYYSLLGFATILMKHDEKLPPFI